MALFDQLIFRALGSREQLANNLKGLRGQTSFQVLLEQAAQLSVMTSFKAAPASNGTFTGISMQLNRVTADTRCLSVWRPGITRTVQLALK